MTGIRVIELGVVLGAGVVLAGCNSSSDNLDEFDFPNFAAIDVAEIRDEVNAPAALTVDGLGYQAALIYEIVLNMRGHDAVERPLDEDTGSRKCEIDGRIFYDRVETPIPSPYIDGSQSVSHVTGWGCTRPLPLAPEVTYTTMGQINFVDTEVDCDAGTCAASYSSFGGSNRYRVQYENPDNPDRSRERVEIHGAYHDGPGEPVDDGGGGSLPVEELTQRLELVSSVESVVDDGMGGETVEEKVVALVYGDSDARFFRREVPDTNEVMLEGRLASGSNGGAECVGGAMVITTPVRLVPDGSDDITAGEIELENDDEEVATLTFEAGGDVSVTDSESATDTFTRGEIETLRDTCFQTVEVRR